MNLRTRLMVIGGLAVLAVGCATGTQPPKGEGPKPVIEAPSSNLLSGKADSADAGTWREVAGSPVDTPHAYSNYADQTWTVSGSRSASRMKVVFERFELETGYDYVFISGANGAQETRHTGDNTGHEIIVDGNEVNIRLVADYSITGWGARFRVFEEQACMCTAEYNPVCGFNGVTYTNACRARCAGGAVAHLGECREDWFRVMRTVESPHDYTNYFDQTFTISEGGASRIRAHFTRIDVERGYDHVRILDGSGRVVQTLTGSHSDVTTVVVEGGTMKVQLVSDYSITGWGFAIDSYEVVGGCNSDADCGSGNRCEQVVCFRAPCFARCVPATGGEYRDVTLAELEADPRAFDGARVRVVAEPIARTPVCTRIACPASNPCCNACSAGYRIGTIPLFDRGEEPFACTGNGCNPTLQCAPFLATEGNGRYRLEGTFRIDEWGTAKLHVETYVAADCRRGGCSSELCSNGGTGISTCVARPEYACYRDAACEPQRGGHCGWTQTPALQACLAAAGNPSDFESTDTPLAIPDNDSTGITSTIAVSRLEPPSRVLVSLQITHTYRGDLRVELIAPDGNDYVLHDRDGGSADNLTLESVDVSHVFGGRAAAGSWRLRVTDRAGLDTGSLVSWSLQFE